MSPVANMLTSIRNAQMVGKETTSLPYSKFKNSILAILKKEGYIEDFKNKGKGVHKEIVITLSYVDKEPQIRGLRMLSRPSQRLYVPKKQIPRSARGGITLLTTPKGVLTGKEAWRQGVGGEIICEIW